jgi:hypothetical protein
MTGDLNALQAAGANIVRAPVEWRAIEWLRAGSYEAAYVERLDLFVNEAAARGIKVLATLATTPPWASAGGAWNDAPANPATLGDFVRWLTSRYGSKLAAVEVWTEPNWRSNLIAPTGQTLAQSYAAMVTQSTRGAREGNPGVAVLAGALAYADTKFLKELWAAGMLGHYDGISVHPYADGARPEDTSVTHSFQRGIEEIHAAQLAAGDPTADWVTEFGWPVGASAGANSEAQQAEYLERAVTRVLAGLPYVAGATAYQLRDGCSNPADPECNFGLLRSDHTPRPAYAALRVALSAVPGTIASG